MRKKLKLLGLLCVVAALAAAVSTTSASAAAITACRDGGVLADGTYNIVVVSGNCSFADGATITIRGHLILNEGAVLNDHAASTATVHVRGAVLGLGTYAPVPNGTSVDGSVLAYNPGTLYLGGMTVHGSVISIGGGDPGRNFPIKDDTIDGNLVIYGWSGLWMGVIRDHVGGSVIVSNNRATDPTQLPGSDSTEVANNDIAGNLICTNNTPAAQLGDTEQPGNLVGGLKLGECAGL
jgi:hypothetical protein